MIVLTTHMIEIWTPYTFRGHSFLSKHTQKYANLKFSQKLRFYFSYFLLPHQRKVLRKNYYICPFLTHPPPPNVFFSNNNNKTHIQLAHLFRVSLLGHLSLVHHWWRQVSTPVCQIFLRLLIIGAVL